VSNGIDPRAVVAALSEIGVDPAAFSAQAIAEEIERKNARDRYWHASAGSVAGALGSRWKAEQELANSEVPAIVREYRARAASFGIAPEVNAQVEAHLTPAPDGRGQYRSIFDRSSDARMSKPTAGSLPQVVGWLLNDALRRTELNRRQRQALSDAKAMREDPKNPLASWYKGGGF
jgi:hypothetical protein